MPKSYYKGVNALAIASVHPVKDIIQEILTPRVGNEGVAPGMALAITEALVAGEWLATAKCDGDHPG